MSKVKTAIRKRRLNYRALVVLGLVTAASLPVLFGLKVLQDRRSAPALMAEVRHAIAEKQPDNALRFLNRYLELHGDELEALDLKAKLLAESTRDSRQAVEAIQVHTRVLGLVDQLAARGKAKTTDWVETRRRLVRLAVDFPILDQVKAVETQADKLVNDLQSINKLDTEALNLRARAHEETANYYENQDERRAALERARRDYEQAEALEPGNVPAAAGLAQLYLDRLSDAKGAADVIDQVVTRTAPGSKGYDPKRHAAALLLRGKFRIRQASPPFRVGGDIAPREQEDLLRKARTDLDEAFRLDPNDVEIRLTQADLAFHLRPVDTALARRYIDTMPEAHKKDRNVLMMEARIDLAEKRPEAAIQAYRSALLQAGGGDAEIVWNLVGLLLDLGRVDRPTYELIQQYKRLSRSRIPDVSQVGVARVEAETREIDARCDYLEGLYLLVSRRPTEALDRLEPLSKKPLRDLTQPYFYYLGRAYTETGSPEKARAAFLQATETAHAWNSPWIALARLDEAERPDDAIETLHRGLAQVPDDPLLVAELAELLYRREMAKPDPAQRSWGEIESLLQRAEQAGGGATTAELLIIRAKYLAATRRFADAVALLETASRSQPRSVDLWKTRVNVEIAQGQFGKAMDLLNQAIQAAGPHADFALAQASVWIRRGEVTRACDALTSMLPKVPGDQQATLYKNLGEVYQSRNEFNQARGAFEAWAHLEPDNPDPRLALFGLALAEGDDATIERSVNQIREVAGDKGYQWRYARVQSLLRDRGGKPPTPEQLAEATKLIEEIRQNDPKLPLSYLLEGQVCERRKLTDPAIAAYTRAVDLKGGDAALTPLVTLLVRTHRTADLEALKRKPGVSPIAVDRMAAMQALKAGDKGEAERLAELAVRGDPQGFDLRNWQAQVFRAVGKPAEAEAALKKLIADDPGNLAHRLQLLMLQASQGHSTEALATVEAMRAAIKPDAYRQLNLDLVWAQCYRAAGNLDRAAECCRDALRKQQRSPDVLRAVVLFFDQSGVPRLRAEALELLQAAYDRDKSGGWERRQLAEMLASKVNDRSSWEKALDVIGRDGDARPDDTAEDKLTRARVYSQSPAAEDRQKAIAILEKLARELPGLLTVQEQLARLLLAENRIPEAREHAARAATVDNATPDTILFYTNVLLAANDTAEAAKQIERLEKLAPEARPVVDMKARLLTQTDKKKEAAALLEKSFDGQLEAADASDIADALVNTLRDLGDPDAALRVARKVATKDAHGRCILARVLGLQGHPDEAASILDDVARTDPALAATTAISLALYPKPAPRWLAPAEGYLTRALAALPASEDPREKEARIDVMEKQALVQHLQGKFDKEVALYNAMFALKPSNLLFLNNYAWTLSEELHQPAEGLKWANEAVKALGPQAPLLDTRGVILTRLGKFEEAVRDLEAANRAAPSASFCFHLAHAYLKLKRPEDARTYRDRARQQGLTREQLQPSEQADWDEVMGR